MPRQNLIRVTRVPYHVTIRTYQQKFFQLPIDRVWNLLLESLAESYQVHPVQLIALVLMGNHYHMLLITPEGNLDLFMFEFNRRFALKIRRELNDETPIFKGRYKWTIIRSMVYFKQCYRYVYQNPLRANICKRVEEYPYSTLNYIVNGKRFPVPIHDKLGFKDLFNLIWLNESQAEIELINIRKMLRRYVCEVTNSPKQNSQGE